MRTDKNSVVTIDLELVH